jgi:hypothetical protein
MNDEKIKYEHLLVEEDTLQQRIKVCDEGLTLLIEYISTTAESIHLLTAEDILSFIHKMQQDLQTELFHLRLEKAIWANKLIVSNSAAAI